MQRSIESPTPEQREKYLRELFDKASSGDGEALTQLGSIASGRIDLPIARELFNKLDGKKEEVNG